MRLYRRSAFIYEQTVEWPLSRHCNGYCRIRKEHCCICAGGGYKHYRNIACQQPHQGKMDKLFGAAHFGYHGNPLHSVPVYVVFGKIDIWKRKFHSDSTFECSVSDHLMRANIHVD